MSVIIALPERLTSKIQKAAKLQGYKRPEEFIIRTVEDKLSDLSIKQRIIEITDKVHTRLAQQGIQEQEIIEDFERFRETLYREREKETPSS